MFERISTSYFASRAVAVLHATNNSKSRDVYKEKRLVSVCIYDMTVSEERERETE